MTKEEMQLALKEFKENLPSYATSEDLQKQMETFETMAAELDVSHDLAELKEAVEKQGLALNKIADKKKTERRTIKEILEENKEVLVGITKGSNKSIVIKADTVRANVTDSEESYNVSDIGQLATRKLTFYDLFNKVPVGAGSGGVITYYDWDEATTVRAAAVVAEGGTYPESTAKWKWYTLSLVKVGDSIPVSEEFEKDLPRFAAELNLFLQTNVDIIVDDQLYDGDGTGNNMTGVYTAATTYTPTTDLVPDASIYDLIVDAKTEITAGKRSKYMPNFAAMNSTDINKYKLKKDANNNYVMPPFVSADGKNIDGLVIIETSAVTANTMLLGDSRFATIYEVDGYTLEKGYKSGDWEQDMPSLKARRRLNIVVKNADAGAFRKVTDISANLDTLDSGA